MHITVDRFRPFDSRTDEVIRLRFPYAPTTTEAIKECLAPLHKQVRDLSRRITNAGGWLPSHHAWFIELAAWPHVRHVLIGLGHTLDETDTFLEQAASVMGAVAIEEVRGVHTVHYLAFGGMNHYPDGGWGDLMDGFGGDHDNLQSAIQKACEIALRSGYDWLHIVDLNSREVVFRVGG